MSSYKNWRVERDGDGIAWLHIDKAGTSTNALSKDLLLELDQILADLEKNLPKGVVFISAKENGFIAGADIEEFTHLKDIQDATELIRRGQAVMDRIEALKVPTVAAIHGFCLGGGCELSLACRYRVADEAPSTKIGLPEVKLGIHPGFGGTVRLPPLVGGLAAMDMMLTGRNINAYSARKMGLVDVIVPLRHLSTAARDVVLHPPKRRKLKGMAKYSNGAFLRPILARVMRKQVAQKAAREHYPAPYAMIDLWARGGSTRKMLTKEAQSVARLAISDSARNLVRVFFLQEGLKKQGDKKLFEPKHVHVIGGGVMGGDIAAWCALRGLTVTIQDRNNEVLGRVIKRAAGLFEKRLKKQPREVQAALDRLIPDREGKGVPHADVIIEAIFENTEAKQSLYREIEPRMKADAILATNTSSIPLEELSTCLKEPDRLVGLHFFNPVAMMPLVEIVVGKNTRSEIVQKASAFARHIDRLPLPVKSSPGFLVNRILMPYLLEAVVLVEEGVKPTLIDQAALDFGMPMGPIMLADTVGLDICLSVAENLGKHYGAPVPQSLRDMVAAGKLGKKSGVGFYNHKAGKAPKPIPCGGKKAPKQVIDRLMLRFLNEAVACLRDSVVADADLLDGGVIFGTGFAPFRGGPVNYIRETGVDTLNKRLNELQGDLGPRFSPDTGWGKLAGT